MAVSWISIIGHCIGNNSVTEACIVISGICFRSLQIFQKNYSFAVTAGILVDNMNYHTSAIKNRRERERKKSKRFTVRSNR